MGDAAVVADAGLLELDAVGKRLEQAPAATQEDVDDVDADSVHQPGGEVLLVDVRAVRPIGLSPATSWAPSERRLDPIGHDREHRIRHIEWPMGDHEARDALDRPRAPTPGSSCRTSGGP